MRGIILERYLKPTAWSVLFLFNLLVFVPWQPILSKSGLDASWAMVLHWAFLHHRDFGRQIVFTYGPWGFLCQGYDPGTYVLSIVMWVFLAGAFFAGVYQLTKTRAGWINLALAAAIFAAVGLRLEFGADVRLLAICWLVFVIHFNSVGTRNLLEITRIALAAAVALASLCKFSVAIAALAVVVLITIDQLRSKRVPSILVAYVAGLSVFWVAARQPLGSFAPYISHSIEIASGYSSVAALSVGDPMIEGIQALLFVICAAPMLISGGPFHRVGILIAIFILFRIGYVRHDVHETIATVGLALLCLMHFMTTRMAVQRKAVRGFSIAGLGACITLAWISLNRWTNSGLPGHVLGSISYVSSPAGISERYRAHVAEFRGSVPEISKTTSVDVYPWMQAALFANGLLYQPRPVMHSYLAFTPRLMKLNADFLRDPARAPEAILFDVASLDDRFPPQEDAASWLEILSRYDVKDSSGAMLVLERSAQPRQYTLESEIHVQPIFTQWIAIPESDYPIWVKIDLNRTLSGAMIDAVYKSSAMLIQVQTADGATDTFRLIPSIARSGFLLSPAITDRQSFAALMSPDWKDRLRGRFVRQIRILAATDTGTTSAYNSNYQLSMSQLVIR